MFSAPISTRLAMRHRGDDGVVLFRAELGKQVKTVFVARLGRTDPGIVHVHAGIVSPNSLTRSMTRVLRKSRRFP